MKIAISTSVIQRGKTGIAQYVFGLLRALAPYAKEHRFVLFALEEDLPLFAFAKTYVELAPVPERFRPAIKNLLWHQLVLPRLVQQGGIDLLHVPSYRRLIWRKPCPRVGTIHDLAPCKVKHKYDRTRMLFAKVAARHLSHRQDHIIAISQNTARDISTFFRVPPERVTVIYNGIDHDRFFPSATDSAKFWAKEHFGLESPFLLYVARLEHPAKNHVRLIEGFNRCKRNGASWKLALAGSDWQNADAIHHAAANSPFARDIRFLDFVPDNQLPELYRAAEAFVYPSLYEGFGLPPIEAMACGCPVIASDRGALEEILGSAARIINPESVENIAAALTEFSDPGLRQKYRELGLKHARCFSWGKTATETMNVYLQTACSGSNLPSQEQTTSAPNYWGKAAERQKGLRRWLMHAPA